MNKMNIEVGNIMLWKRTSIINKLIRVWDFFKYGFLGYSHASILIGYEDNEYIVAEERFKGLIISHYSEDFINQAVKSGLITFFKTKKPLNTRLLNRTVHKWLGTPYGFWEDFEDLANIHLSDGRLTMNCSEVVSRLVYVSSNKQINLAKELNKKFDNITPTDLSLTKSLVEIK